MSSKYPDILSHLTPANNTRRINGSPKSMGSFARIVNKHLTNHKQLLLRLHKLEEVNASLEELIADGKKQLNETVATNARSLSLLAHDLRGPFSTTIVILDLLTKSFDAYDKIEIEKLINAASDAAIKSLTLLENLLAWSISQNKEKTFNPVRINLNELIINEFNSFKTTAAQKHLSMNHSVESNLCVTGDIQMVKTIFRNLISNAIKYSNTGGTIFISATEAPHFVEIEVKDDGIGIEQKTRQKLFKIDEFHSTSGTNNEQGTGLGLLFCKEFIDLHGGQIQVKSEPGKGSRFIFTLPHYI
jgi:signal transduction histidine kinase